jgi:ankyrin repeat protein
VSTADDALSAAVRRGDLAAARSALAAGADASITITEEVPGERSIEEVTVTLLERALATGREDLALLLLEHGAPATGPGLRLATERQLLRAVDELLRRGVRDGDALVAAAELGDLALVQRLAASIPASTRALSAACLRGHRAVAEWLVEAGADVNGAETLDPLQAAAWRDRVEMIDWLLERGVDLARSGPRALELAANAGSTRAVRVLHARGVSLDGRNGYGWTPLMLAAYQGQLETVRCLVEAGADRAAADAGGKRAIDWARERGHAEVVTLLATRTST